MPRYDFITIVTDIEVLMKLNTTKRNTVKRTVQSVLDRISSAWESWPHLMDRSFFTTVAPHEDGTIDVTNGSATITGTSSNFTAAMVDRKISVDSEDAFYRIKAFVSSTEVTLEVPYGGTTATGSSYKIFQDEYRLAPDCDRHKVLRHVEDSVALMSVGASVFDIIIPSATNDGTPNFDILSGTQEDTYETGTVSMSTNGTTITGASSPAWTSVQGLGRGSRIIIGSQVFTVKTVDSDTQLTTYEASTVGIAGGTAYKILLNNLIVQLYQVPDAVENIYYRYQRYPFPLVSDTDQPDMPILWNWLLIEGTLALMWKVKDKLEADKHELRFRAGLEDMKRAMGMRASNKTYKRRSIDQHHILFKGPRTTSDRGAPFTP